jgi:hypothetical protein
MKTLTKITTVIAIGSLLALGACKKDKKEGGDETAEGKKPTDGTENPCAGKENPCAAGKTSMEDKKKMANDMVAMLGEAAKAIEANPEDCAAMAGALNKVADDHKAQIDKIKEMMAKGEEKDPAFDAWFKETHQDNMTKTMGSAMGAMMKKCAQDEGVKTAWANIMPSGDKDQAPPPATKDDGADDGADEGADTGE